MKKSSKGAGAGNGNADGSSGGLDDSTLASAIGNGEDLGTIIRAAFEIGKPDALLQQLRGFVRKKEVEIEDLCRVHYEEFIRAVDELRNVLVDAEELKKRLAEENSEMQDVGRALLGKVEDLIEWHGIRANLTQAMESLKTCAKVVDVCAKVNEHMDKDELYPALKGLDTVERDYLQRVPARGLCLALERQIPMFRAYIEKKVSREFNDWLVDIRGVAREIGQLSIGQASSARQREEELRVRQRQAEEQSRWGSNSGSVSGSAEEWSGYVLLDTEEEGAADDSVVLKLELTAVYRAHYIHACLGLGAQFRGYYLENRRLQLMSDLHVPPGPFLECHQVYFAQMAGFFIVEDRVLRTAGGLIDGAQVDALWESAVTRMAAVLEEQFSRMQAANHVLLVKDNVSLLAATLRGYGYHVAPLLDVLDRTRDRYHELLLGDCRRQVADVLANDKFEQMLMLKEYEYGMNVLAFQLQSSDVSPAFPYVAPFSASVPDCCRIVRSFVEDSVNFLSHGGHADYYEVVRRYCDKLLVAVLNEALLKLIRSPTLGMSQAMQLAANLTVLERACDFFAAHVARLCGVPSRLAGGSLEAKAVLRKSQSTAQEQMLELVNSKIDEFMVLTAHIEWMPDDAPHHGNAYLNEVVIYLETLTPSAQAILPLDAFDKWIRGVLTHISDCIVATFLSDDVRRFNINAVMGIDADLRVLESFAHERTAQQQLPNSDLRSCLAESRQLVNLLLSKQPELFLNPVIREKNYSALDYKKVMLVAEKYRDMADKLFRGGGAKQALAKHPTKKQSFDTLLRRLREFG